MAQAKCGYAWDIFLTCNQVGIWKYHYTALKMFKYGVFSGPNYGDWWKKEILSWNLWKLLEKVCDGVRFSCSKVAAFYSFDKINFLTEVLQEFCKTFGRSRLEVFYWKDFLKNFAIFTEKHLRWSLFLKSYRTPVWNFIKKETPAQTFYCEFCKIFKNAFFTEQLHTTDSQPSEQLIPWKQMNGYFCCSCM